MSAFKQLFTQMIAAGGDENKLPADLRKKDLQVFVKESKPYFLVSDSYFYVPAYFTPAALTEFKGAGNGLQQGGFTGSVGTGYGVRSTRLERIAEMSEDPFTVEALPGIS